MIIISLRHMQASAFIYAEGFLFLSLLGGFMRIIVATNEGESRNATPRPFSGPKEGKSGFYTMGIVKKKMFQEGIISEVGDILR